MKRSSPLKDRALGRLRTAFGTGPDPEDEAAEAPPSMLAVLRRERLRTLEFFFALLPGGLVVYFSFTSGGYFPGSAGIGAAFLGGLLALRLVLLPDPRPALTRASIIAIVAMALFVAWTYLSRTWSDAPARSTIATDLGLVYLFALMLFASFPAENRRLRWMLRGLAAGIVVVAVAAVVSRTLPNVIDVATLGIGDDRLAYPLTYWNSLGFLAGVGFVICLHITRSTREKMAPRGLAAAALPATAACVYLTLSRGAIVTTGVGVALYLMLARRGGLLPTLVAAGPPVAIALIAAYDAEMLTSLTYKSAAAMEQGQRLAIVIGGASALAFVVRLAIAPYESRMRARSPFRHVGRGPRLAGAGLLSVAVVGAAIAVGAPGTLTDAYDGFFKGRTGGAADLETSQGRLTQTTGNGRNVIWGIGLDEFSDSPVRGSGAGTFELVWLERRETPENARNAHSIYIETLAELGIVGFALLVLVVAMILLGSAARIRGTGRSTYALVFGVTVAWALHSGVDWDWQMPATTVWMFALGGAALAAAPSRIGVASAFDPDAGPGLRRNATGALRVALAVGIALVAILPARFALSQRPLDRAIAAFERGDCRKAPMVADEALRASSVRPEAHVVKGYCALGDGDSTAAIASMDSAVSLDPDNPAYHYALAQALAAAGRSPDREADTVRRLDPRDPRRRQNLDLLTAASSPGELRGLAEEIPNTGLSRGLAPPAVPVFRLPSQSPAPAGQRPPATPAAPSPSTGRLPNP